MHFVLNDVIRHANVHERTRAEMTTILPESSQKYKVSNDGFSRKLQDVWARQTKFISPHGVLVF